MPSGIRAGQTPFLFPGERDDVVANALRVFVRAGAAEPFELVGDHRVGERH
jgi:hypothetical protein